MDELHHPPAPPGEGLRARKRRETRQRIIDRSVELFVANGFEATTLDAIAAAADISRRTFFYYFTSKENILTSWQDGAEAMLRAAVTEAAPGRSPFEASRLALRQLASGFATEKYRVIDTLMRSTDSLKAKQQGHYEQQEQGLYATLSGLWPDPAQRPALRVVALLVIGAMRLATDAWIQSEGRRPIVECLDEAFAAIHHVADEG